MAERNIDIPHGVISHTEKPFRESEEKFRLLFEKFMDPILLLDGEVFIDCNEAALRVLQCSTKDQVTGLRPFDMSPERQPDGQLSSEKARDLIRATLEKGFNRFEWMHRDFRGKDLLIEVSLTVIPIDGKEVICTVWRDIGERKKAETLLKESEERYRIAIEYSNDAVAIVRDETHLFVNKKFLEMYGYDRLEDIVGKGYEILVHPDDEAMVREHSRKRQAGEEAPSRYELKGIKRDGTTIRAEASVARIEYCGRPASLAFFRDITEIKQAESALRRSEAKFRAIVENSNDGMMFIDANGGISYQSPSFNRINGYADGERMGRTAFEIVHPDDLEKTRQGVMQVLKDPKTPLTDEYRIRHKDGRWLWIEATGENLLDNPDVKAIVIVMRDITERKKAEEELRLLKHSIDVHYDAAFWMDTDNRFIYVNDAACTSLGYTREELIGKAVLDISPERAAEAMVELWQRLRAEGSLVYETVHQRKDGSEFPVEIVVTYVNFGGSEYACGFARDISERQMLQREVMSISAAEQARIGQDLHDNLGQLLTGIALKSKSLANFLERKSLPGAEDAIRVVDLANQAAAQAGNLARNLLSADIDHGGICAWLEDLSLRVTHLYGVSCTFSYVPENIEMERVVAHEFYRIAHEASMNAIKHGKASSVSISLHRKNHVTTLRIEDNGVGFSHAKRTDGIGLRLMNYRAQSIGASLDVHDTGKGGTVAECVLADE